MKPMKSTVGEFLTSPLRLVGWLWRHRPRWEQPRSPNLRAYIAIAEETGSPYSHQCWQFLDRRTDDTELQARAAAYRSIHHNLYPSDWSTK